MARYEVRLKRPLRVDTETLAAGTHVATVECDLPLRMAASLILSRGIVVGEDQVEVSEVGKAGKVSNGAAANPDPVIAQSDGGTDAEATAPVAEQPKPSRARRAKVTANPSPQPAD